MFGSSRTSRTQYTTSTTTPRRGFFGNRSTRPRRTTGTRRGLFRRPNPNRQAAGYKAALHNPNTTRVGRKHAKNELRVMGRGHEAHGRPSLKSRLKRMFGIRSRTTRSRATRSGYY